jgi:HAD-superfamily subfamily IB hydrolase, TIGR01490
MDLAVFDLDHTLLADDSDYRWGQFLVAEGLVEADRYEATNRAFYEDYLAGRLDIQAFCRFSLEPLTRIPPAELSDLRARFVEQCIRPAIAPGAPALLAAHREAGDELLITTATNRFVTEPIAALLGVRHLLATEPELRDGRYTGALAEEANFREGKVHNLRRWLAVDGRRFEKIVCYSDSRNDLPLLAMADVAVAVDPDSALRAEAARRGWRIISLREPRDPAA